MTGVKKFNTPFHGLRGVASLMVFFAHIINGYVLHVDSNIGAGWSETFSNVGVFGVEIFFFLSGFVIYKASLRSDVKTFFTHRFWRIYPLFLLFTLIFFFVNEVLRIELGKLGVVNLVSNLFFADLFFNTPSLTPNAWSITYEIWYYITTFFIVSFLINRTNKLLFSVVSLIAIYFIVLYPVTIYFILGVLLAISEKNMRYISREIGLYKHNFIQLTSLIFLILVVSSGDEFTWSAIHEQFSILVIPLLLFVFMTSLLVSNSETIISKFLSTNLLVYFGNVSFTLYLAHPYSYYISRHLVNKYKFDFIPDFILFIIFLTLTCVLTITFTFYLSKYYENYIFKKMTGKSIYLNVKAKSS